MIRSLLGLLLILIGLSLMATGLNGDSSVIESHHTRFYGTYAGAALMVLGFIIGKFWSLKWEPKRKAVAGSSMEPQTISVQREEPVEEQIDLFDEPRKRA